MTEALLRIDLDAIMEERRTERSVEGTQSVAFIGGVATALTSFIAPKFAEVANAPKAHAPELVVDNTPEFG